MCVIRLVGARKSAFNTTFGESPRIPISSAKQPSSRVFADTFDGTSTRTNTRRICSAGTRQTTATRPFDCRSRTCPVQSAESSERIAATKNSERVQGVSLSDSGKLSSHTFFESHQLHLRHAALEVGHLAAHRRTVNGHEIVAVHQDVHEHIQTERYAATAVRLTRIVQRGRCPHDDGTVMVHMQERHLVVFLAQHKDNGIEQIQVLVQHVKEQCEAGGVVRFDALQVALGVNRSNGLQCWVFPSQIVRNCVRISRSWIHQTINVNVRTERAPDCKALAVHCTKASHCAAQTPGVLPSIRGHIFAQNSSS